MVSWFRILATATAVVFPPLVPAMPEARAAADIRQQALQSRNPEALQEAFFHSVRRGDEAICQDLLQSFEGAADEALGNCNNPEEKQQRIDYTGWLVSEMSKALEASEHGSATLRDVLEELARYYPRREHGHHLRL